jgi:hypothetical protein
MFLRCILCFENPSVLYYWIENQCIHKLELNHPFLFFNDRYLGCFFFGLFPLLKTVLRTARQKGPIWGVGISRKEKEVKKRCKKVNMVQMLYTYVCKWKNDTLKTFQEWRKWGWRRTMEGWIQLWYIWYIVRTFANATIYLQHNNFLKKNCSYK